MPMGIGVGRLVYSYPIHRYPLGVVYGYLLNGGFAQFKSNGVACNRVGVQGNSVTTGACNVVDKLELGHQCTGTLSGKS